MTETPYQKTNIVDANGNVINSFGGSGGGSDATATNQTTQIQLETAIRDRIGDTAITGANMPGGGVGLFGWLSAIWKLISDRLPILTLVGDRLKIDGSGVTQPVSATSLPLPNGAATEMTLQQVKSAILAQIDIASTIWTDNSGAFYVRRDLVNEGTGTITVAFTDPSGNAATPGAGLRPLATTDKDTITDFYDVTVSGTGYSVGDLLARIGILDVNSNTPSATFVWLNLTSGAILSSAPSNSNIERANENIGARQIGTWNFNLPPNAATESTLATLLTQGSAATGVTGPSGGSGAFKWLSGIWQLLSDRLPISLGPKTAANSIAVTLSTDGVFSTNFGAQADSAATSSSDSWSAIALLKGLLANLIKPTTRTEQIITLTTALSENSFSFTSAKRIMIFCRTRNNIRTSITSGDTINSARFRTIYTGYEDEEAGINYTGNIYISSESIPSTTVASCITINGSNTVTTSNSFSSFELGSAVSGTGIPAVAYLATRNAAGTSITLNSQPDGKGIAVNATASGTVTLTFSGAVVRASAWA